MGALSGRVACVSGGSNGIGAAIVRALAQEGAAVAALDVTPAAADAEVTFVECDVSQSESVRNAVAQVRESLGVPDIMIHSAGIGTPGTVISTADEDWDRVLGVNLTGAMYLMRETMGDMIERGWGRIITISSAAAVRPRVARAAYVTSKAGLIGLTKAAALEGARSGVTANVVAPGLTDTALTRGAFGDLASTALSSEVSNPMGVVLQPDDIAGAVLFLCLPASSKITGQVLHVNAGGVMP